MLGTHMPSSSEGLCSSRIPGDPHPPVTILSSIKTPEDCPFGLQHSGQSPAHGHCLDGMASSLPSLSAPFLPVGLEEPEFLLPKEDDLQAQSSTLTGSAKGH